MDLEKTEKLQTKLTNISRDAEERDAKKRSEIENIPYVDTRKTPASIEAVKKIKKEDAEKGEMVGIQLNNKNLAVAVYKPKNKDTQRIIEELEKEGLKTTIYIASKSGIHEMWQLYEFVKEEKKEITGRVDIDKKRFEELTKKLKTLDVITKTIGEIDFSHMATKELLETIIAGALANKASDIHLEKEDKKSRIRFRIDGLLHDVTTVIPDKNYNSLISRIKLLSGMKINVRGEAQDGRFSIGITNKEIEMRVSIIPSEFGETAVLRVLDPDAINVGLKELGLREEDLVLVEKTLKKPNGLILNTGPTGSGKTTTLYAFLKRIVSPEIKIITIEDPIEYQLDGIEQTQTNKDTSYDFASGLRAIVRQDPDVILVGEIRDKETANISLQASLTGHLVLSTLHTNDAIGAIPRLINLDIKPDTIGPALSLVIAQRLVRKLCESCKKETAPSEEIKDYIKKLLERISGFMDTKKYENYTLYSPGSSCEDCGGIGYKGRIGIFEFLKGGPDLEEAILSSSVHKSLEELVEKQKMIPLKDDGILKALIGQTSIEEIERVAGSIQ